MHAPGKAVVPRTYAHGYQVKIVFDDVVNLFATKPTEAGVRDTSEGLVPHILSSSLVPQYLVYHFTS